MIMIRMFVDRDLELSMLERAYAKPGFQCYIIYGRRRIGKTEIIKKFIENKQAIYYLCDKQGLKNNVDQLAALASQVLDTPRFAADDLVELFTSITRVVGMQRKLVIAIDEFPYLIEHDAAVPSIFQRVIDEILNSTSIFLILCGSSISMMEESTMSPTSPLHGRRTGQIKVKEMSFKELAAFFPAYTMHDLVLAYSILGGVPAYLAKFDPSIPVLDNVDATIFQKDQVLYEEIEHLLHQELREPRQYMLILEAMAKGNTRVSTIANAAGIAAKDLPAYLSVLIKLDIIEKVQPVTENRPMSRRSLYRLHDGFYKFWFRFVYPNKGMVEIGRIEALHGLVQASINDHASLAFENTCREFLVDARLVPVEFTRAGTWWDKDVEIDIACLNLVKHVAVFGEWKWQDAVEGAAVAKKLREKSARVDWMAGKRTDYLVVFARSFTKAIKDEERVKYVDLGMLARHFGITRAR